VSQKADLLDVALTRYRQSVISEYDMESFRMLYDLGRSQGLSDAARAVVRDGYYEQSADLIRRIHAESRKRRKKVLG
jgi:hypothetical protein